MTGNYFLSTVKFEKTAEEGKIVKTSEQYLIDALSFSEAEERIIKEMKPFISGEFLVKTLTRYKVNEIFDSVESDKIFKVKANFVILDEQKGIEKKTPCSFLVYADDIKSAEANFKTGMTGSMSDYRIEKIEETKILDIFKFEGDPVIKQIDKIETVLSKLSDLNEEVDPLIRSAAISVIERNEGSISFLQRTFSLGYNRAGRIMESLEKLGVVGVFNGVKNRDVLMTIEQFEAICIV